ncbi:MAG TPA: ABC transporter substrate-binding protein [Syntrophorhabdaceae bacterium]|nr:ABC transporter substrate-binding protein [Syntrophorhabdaceae bacterium]
MLTKFPLILLLLCLSLFYCAACTKTPHDGEKGSYVTIVFTHGKIPGDYEQFKRILRQFERENPGIRVVDRTLPSSTDEQHQFYVINLDAGSKDFDVLSMDVIWVPEFAMAGWLRDVSGLLSESELHDIFPGPLEAVTYMGKRYAVPWYIDAGLLYYRKDLLDDIGAKPPKTWDELVRTARLITERSKGIYGFIWQGKQYEGLVCDVLEYLWSHGGNVLENGKVVLHSPENVRALTFMRELIVRDRVSPEIVTTLVEESSRHIFGNGRAVFMRNWPYAWNIFERDGSPVKGKIGVAALPSAAGHPSASTLGGWQIGINRHSKHPDAAERFVRFLTSRESQKTLALTVGYKPTRRSLYSDADLKRQQPFIASLHDILLNARPRPVSPYYMMMTQILQPEFSAAIAGIKKPSDALMSAERQVQHVLGVRP